ncbi:DNA repair ATPase [Carboxylicivirga sp. N1Y90]|uniref:DNA repair ATPase n=1 Tax=Carboxylicivirga fragile TaxID=3417571 RepID=UPI003D3505BE|nr:DNA repair ATPase [Marinilabiliaceae bacterium N1Y90]
MSDKPNTANEKNIQLEEGTYEIIKNRLRKNADDLGQRLDKLNVSRKEVFGSIESSLVATDRISTQNNCSPVDMVSIGSSMIFGYNVIIGLKTKTSLDDVFSIYSYEDRKFSEQSLSLIEDDQFLSDFENLYEYYKTTRFIKFASIGPHLYMVFQIGKKTDDIKAFKWLVKGDKLEYKGNRHTHEFVFPDQHEFQWTKATREQYVYGEHPHVSIEDIVFVEAVGGDLTIKIEDNTDSGLGIYAEEVEVPDQTLDDSEIHYAIVGNLVVIRILPYKEKDFRYFVYNSKVQEVKRIDALEDSCVLLPDDQGLIFANGYYLQNGQFKVFDGDFDNLMFERKVASFNGEDFLYVFFNQEVGTYVLLIYNLINQKIETPLICNGYSMFDNGELCYFKGHEEASKHHTIQVWTTPFMTSDHQLPASNNSRLYKIGNKDVVKAMAECREVMLLVNKDESYNDVYGDLVKQCTSIVDSYYWLAETDAFDIKSPLLEIKKSAFSAISEYEKVRSIRKSTTDSVNDAEVKVKEIFRHISSQNITDIDRYVQLLADLRAVRGEIISLQELRYVDLDFVKELEQSVEEKTHRLSQDCVTFLLRDEALDAYEQKVEKIRSSVGEIAKVSEADDLSEEIVKLAGQLEMLIDIVSNLKIDDATQTTQIINNISAVYSQFNIIKADLKKQRKGLRAVEAKAEFASQLRLVEQGMLNYLDLCDSPGKADEYLSKLMVQLEELEGKFSDFEEFMESITQKREQVYNAFESKKLSLVEKRNRKTTALQSSAERILKAIRNRVSKFKEINEVNGYFASDLMIEKVRDVITELKELDDNIKADDLESKLKSLKEETVRQLKDKQELFEDGSNIIKFGNHKFSVNTQNLELSMINKDGEMYYHLSSTNFFEQVRDESFLATKEIWNQVLPSEDKNVYRSEFLAYQIYTMSLEQTEGSASLKELKEKDETQLQEYVQGVMSLRYNEGYSKGVHDVDAALILRQMLNVYFNAGLLRFSADARAMAEYFWNAHCDEVLKSDLNNNLKGAGLILQVFPDTKQFNYLLDVLEKHLCEFNNEEQLFDAELIKDAASYLLYQIAKEDNFILSKEASVLFDGFQDYLRKNRASKQFKASVEPLKEDKSNAYRLIRNWVSAYFDVEKKDTQYLNEVSISLLLDSRKDKTLINQSVKCQLEGLKGSHNLLHGKAYSFDFNEFVSRLKHFVTIKTTLYTQYTRQKKQLTEQFADDLRLHEFKPRVLSSFVRNKLIDKVYFPLIGNNLAKQIGAEGAGKRTDLMGMLLLISPPGYGKTTLMEYLASRLGIIFMKINGPSIGHVITSLDPSEAVNAAAREELEKLNLAFEMGDNVMIYLDDIQHCNPEFLQKFISLCDAQRKVEGVYKGKSKTYDFRGKKVCVVMAGNPYTESGDKFKIPDMLANRADIYNIGDIIGGSDEEFKMSYIENSLTSNPVLNKLSSKSQADLYTLISIAETGQKDGHEFEAAHTPEEINDYVDVLKKLIKARDVILKVNLEYISSAAQADEYRTEPAFKLQGSYRDMNKISEKILPIMNEEELNTLLLSHYRNEAQTLTTGAEANMLKFKELYGVLNEEDKLRWTEVKEAFVRNNKLKGLGEDGQTANVLIQMEEIAKGVLGIKDELGRK